MGQRGRTGRGAVIASLLGQRAVGSRVAMPSRGHLLAPERVEEQAPAVLVATDGATCQASTRGDARWIPSRSFRFVEGLAAPASEHLYLGGHGVVHG